MNRPKFDVPDIVKRGYDLSEKMKRVSKGEEVKGKAERSKEDQLKEAFELSL